MAVTIGITQWTFPGFHEDTLLRVKEAGLDALQPELGSYEERFPLSGAQVQRTYLQESKRAGLKLLPLAVNALCDHGFVDGLDTPDGMIALQALRQGIEAAAAMGLEGITVPNFGVNRIRNQTHYENTVLALSSACRLAQGLGVYVYTENVLSPDQMDQLFRDCGYPNLRLLFDSQNYTHFGFSYAVDVLRRHFERMGTHLHVKSGTSDLSAPLGEGEGPVLEVLALLKERDYGGTIVLENNYASGPLFAEEARWMRHDIDVIRGMMG